MILLVPMGKFSSGRPFVALAFAYAVMVLAAALLAIQGIVHYLQGGKHWGIIPASLVIASIPAANALLLWWTHRASSRAPN